MKLTWILLTVFVVQLRAESLAQSVTIKAENMPLKQFIVQLHKITGYNFIGNSETIGKAPKVTLNAKEATLTAVFEKCFTANGINYVINKDEGTVVLSQQIAMPEAKAPPQTIKGVVTDEKGGPLPGATVTVKGTTVATQTTNIGSFSINVPEGNKVLVFSLVGFETQEVTIVDTKPLNVVLKEKTSRLDEVVVIGYGTQKRGDITSAQSSLSSSAITERAVSRVDQALVGQIAGVNVKQSTGLPGKGFSVQVRGTSSVTANTEPLYVIDGFPLGQATQDATGNFPGGNPLDNLNPEDIESIEVLKDAAAAAIYGSRATNGVVLITTKKGKIGKPKIQLSSSYGYSKANRKVDVLSAEEWIDRATEIINTNYITSYGSRGATIADDRARRIAIIGSNSVNFIPDPRWSTPGHPGLTFVDWQDQIFRTAGMQNYQMSASGGTSNINYFVSASHINQEGIVKYTGNKQYSVRANIEAAITPKFKVGLNLAPSFSILQDPGIEGKDVIMHLALSLPPVVEDTAGVYTNAFRNNPYAWAVQLNSPLAKAENQVGETKRSRTIASLYGIYNLLKGLTFKSSINYDNSNIDIKRYMPYTVTSLPSNRIAQTTALATGNATANNYQSFVNENTLNYSATVKKYHSFNVLLGQSYNYFYSEGSSITAVGGYVNKTVQTLNAAAGWRANTSAAKNVLISYFSRFQYAFKNKYLLSASIRTDGSSRFGSNTKYGVFPAGSLGWKISEESFMKPISVISDLKLRATYGVTGNNAIPDFGHTPTLGNFLYVTGGALAPGQAPNRLANPDLKWEKSSTVDFGLDFGFFKNRVTGSFDYYNRLTEDMLLNAPALAITGFPAFLSNVGSIRNRGLELEISTRNIVGKFQWTTSLQGTYNTNKVVALGNGQKQLLLPSLYGTNGVSTSIIRVGEPLNSIYVVKQIGILSAEDIQNGAARFGTQAAGDPKYEDFDKNGVIDPNDRQIVGQPNPKYIWGITNTFNYKGFDLRVFIQGQNGGSIYSLLGRAISKTDLGFIYNMTADYRDRWRSAQSPGAGLRGKATSNFGSIVNSDWLYSSDYFRVRNITLGYNLKNVIKLKQVSGARVFVSAENYFGKDKYYGGANPEAANTDLTGNGNFPQSGDYGSLPLPKALVFGLNFSF